MAAGTPGVASGAADGTGRTTPGPGSVVVRAVVGGWRGLVWYLEGMMGADAYKKYVAHHRAVHPGVEPLGERQFWREKMDAEDANPQGRCC
ncbi:YbdD/YjiX family protein [Zafaria sp. Z1313]|uniref:YbdD/YjiX family protein n=1 Tax=unclassified Zafaria TaxID=2828765 RepID=UPI002E7953F2|nr:YbdD/YjiX family protein [Zafaria sp. J156]MEE1622043.1 YbdD/YjiX family protein [Zafaria sp. J156]